MNFNKLTVIPKIPESIKMLEEIAYNVWWSWNSNAIELFRQLNPDLWEENEHNPIKTLNTIEEVDLIAASESNEFLELYQKVIADYTEYMNANNTWFQQNYMRYDGKLIAYLCAEYGIHESIPIYSGGLGVLAGDHLKSASDMGIPLVAIGLLYKNGYFVQQIQKSGNQKNIYIENKIDELPIKNVIDNQGKEIIISVTIDDEEVYAKAWEINVGINKLYLLDTNVDNNSEDNKNITDTLYGGDQSKRVKQEMILGIGGVKLIRALGLNPYVWHINEGHSAFFVFERIKEYMDTEEMDFYEAMETAKSNAIFTTHTPVSAGNDMFPFDMIEKHFRNYFGRFRTNKQYLLNLGEFTKENGEKVFSTTVLALKTTTYSNAVSKLHGNVSRELWKNVWHEVPVNEIPIDHITNGVHTFTWLSKSIKRLLSNNFEKEFRNNIDDKAIWDNINNISNNDLWEVHQFKKQQLFDLIKARIIEQRMREYQDIDESYDFELDKNVLTIGFARRFATYKRADLIFRDIDRLRSIVNNYKKPVQIIFAGKAHPADIPGQNIIKNIYELSRQDELKDKIIFVENYDMNLARAMIQGVDVWLNNPRRPYEASGTSGQKAAANGVLNFSVLDGWWCEGYNEENGWVIGDYRKYDNNEQQDTDESKKIYEVLENEIIPLYYEKNDAGFSDEWVKKMKNSINSIAWFFNMHRQVKEYYEKFYKNCIENKMKFDDKKVELAKNIKIWKERIYKNWENVEIKGIKRTDTKISYGDEIKIKANVCLEDLEEKDVVVEAYIGILDEYDNIVEYKTIPMNKSETIDEKYSKYETSIKLDSVGRFAYTTRIIPNNIYLANSKEVGLIKWAE